MNIRLHRVVDRVLDHQRDARRRVVAAGRGEPDGVVAVAGHVGVARDLRVVVRQARVGAVGAHRGALHDEPRREEVVDPRPRVEEEVRLEAEGGVVGAVVVKGEPLRAGQAGGEHLGPNVPAVDEIVIADAQERRADVHRERCRTLVAGQPRLESEVRLGVRRVAGGARCVVRIETASNVVDHLIRIYCIGVE